MLETETEKRLEKVGKMLETEKNGCAIHFHLHNPGSKPGNVILFPVVANLCDVQNPVMAEEILPPADFCQTEVTFLQMSKIR